MTCRFFDALCLTGALLPAADAGGAPEVTFVDGRWQGGIETAPGSPDTAQCWARTTDEDGTTLTLAERKDGAWLLRLSNSGWHLPFPHRYAMVTQVDFYPRLRVVAETMGETVLEIADPAPASLVGQIEFGHTIDLAAEGFSGKYNLEGSAKIIERIRNCFAGQTSADMPAATNGP